MPVDFHRLIRAFAFVWRRLGSAGVYVAAIAGAVVVLAAIGIWHLVASAKPSSPAQSAIARISPGAELSVTPSALSSAATPAEFERQVEITKIEQTEKTGRHGETFVVATIGIASRANLEKNGVEIHVYFYDLTAGNEIRPTDAQVTYEWLTPIRDWSDPTPKYLAATYFKRPVRQRSLEKLRYGGLVARVFSGGKLQDEQSHPETLLTSFRNNAVQQPAPTPSTGPVNPSTEPTSLPLSRRSLGEGPSPTPVLAVSKRTTSPTSPSPVPTDTADETPLPFGKPISGKPGFLYSPYDEKFIIDVRGFPPGTLVNDPNTNKPFRVP